MYIQWLSLIYKGLDGIININTIYITCVGEYFLIEIGTHGSLGFPCLSLTIANQTSFKISAYVGQVYAIS